MKWTKDTYRDPKGKLWTIYKDERGRVMRAGDRPIVGDGEPRGAPPGNGGAFASGGVAFALLLLAIAIHESRKGRRR